MTAPIRTVCLRDCPDACGLLVQVEQGAITDVRGDPEHPITRGFICRRTKRDYPAWLQRPDRIVHPRIRSSQGWRDAPWDEALDLCAQHMRAAIEKLGPQAVMFLQSGGSMGLSAEVCRSLFDRVGASAVGGGVCMDAGEWAQQTDFGELRMSAQSDLRNTTALVLWGRNPHTACPHLLPDIQQLRKRGAPVVLIDPLPTRAKTLASRVLQPRPGRDGLLALAVARVLFEQGWVDPQAATFCDELDAFRSLCMRRSVEQGAALCDVAPQDILDLGRLYGSGQPVATLIGGGLQRWADGAETVRIIDALCTISGSVGVAGGGAWFETPRRRGLRLPQPPAQRELRAAMLGHDLEQASSPPIRFGWIQRCNPVAQFPDARRIASALRSLDFLVVVDAFLTDTAELAHVILPPALMLECDDLVGAYGHHRLGLARRAVTPRGEARTDLEIVQGLAARLGHSDMLAGTIHDWIDRMLEPLGMTRRDFEGGTLTRPGEPTVAFEGRRFATESGRANLITAFEPQCLEQPKAFPLHLLSVAPIEFQASQMPPEAQQGLPEVTAHPEAAGVNGRDNGTEVIVRSEVDQLRARLHLDSAMRRDTVLIYRGGWLRHGHCVNALVAGRESRNGGCAAYFDERVRLE